MQGPKCKEIQCEQQMVWPVAFEVPSWLKCCAEGCIKMLKGRDNAFEHRRSSMEGCNTQHDACQVGGSCAIKW